MNGTKETKGGGARVSTSANEWAREGEREREREREVGGLDNIRGKGKDG